MAFIGFGKKKKKQAEPTATAAPGSPVDQIMVLKQQGMDNNKIIQELEKQGYSSSQIFDALNQINISGNPAVPEQPPGMGMQPPPQDLQAEQPFMGKEPQGEGVNKEQIEEIAEVIIDEKWKEFENDVKKILEWKDNTDLRIIKLEQQIKDLANGLNTLHKSIINKISQYDRNIMDVGIEIKAMEKVFQKVLPSLTENVNKLERLSKGSKLGKK